MAGTALAEHCLAAANGDPWKAIAFAIRMTRFKEIEAGRLQPSPHEQLPGFVRDAAIRHRRHAEARRLAVFGRTSR